MRLAIHIIKSTLIKMMLVTGLLFLTFEANSAVEKLSDKIKAAYVFNFIKYIEWPAEENIVNFRIAYLGNDKGYAEALKKIHGMKIKHFNIDFIKIPSIEQSDIFQILILDKTQSKYIDEISKQIGRRETLIVSDNAVDKKSTMINFIQTNDNIVKFELNRYQMLNAHLKVSSDILVLGGTELDIANVLKEMDATITSSLNEINQQSSRLAQLKDNITSRENELALQRSKLAHQQQKLSSQDKKLEQQDGEIKQNKQDFQVLQKSYQQTTKELDASRVKLENNIDSLHNLKSDIQQKELSIYTLELQIKQRKEILNNIENQYAEQKQELAKQSSVIQTQSIVLILTVALSFVILVFLIVIYKSRKILHKVNQKLQVNIEALAEANFKLSTAQDQLVESAKMASLGGLVAGVAHEINTPIGVSVTAISHLADQVDAFEKEYEAGPLKKSSLEGLLANAKDSSDILTRNLQRASALISNFKQVAVDQSSENRRKFELKAYIKELIQSLQPQFKQNCHQVHVSANKLIKLNSFPGVIAQIVTNLIMNSIRHGFKNKTHGKIIIVLTIEDNQVVIDYLDDGVGLTDQQREKVFDPFYTTARSTGGSGLGMSISYNLITSKLNGTISVLNSSEGAHFLITFPQ